MRVLIWRFGEFAGNRQIKTSPILSVTLLRNAHTFVSPIRQNVLVSNLPKLMLAKFSCYTYGIVHVGIIHVYTCTCTCCHDGVPFCCNTYDSSFLFHMFFPSQSSYHKHIQLYNNYIRCQQSQFLHQAIYRLLLLLPTDPWSHVYTEPP